MKKAELPKLRIWESTRSLWMCPIWPKSGLNFFWERQCLGRGPERLEAKGAAPCRLLPGGLTLSCMVPTCWMA